MVPLKNKWHPLLQGVINPTCSAAGVHLVICALRHGTPLDWPEEGDILTEEEVQ